MLCIFISLLLVTVCFVCNRMGSGNNIAIIISFDASLLMHINSTNIPPIMTMNRMYENQNLLYIFSLTSHTIVVCIGSISPMAMGCFICVNINLLLFLLI